MLNTAVLYTPEPIQNWVEHQRTSVRQAELRKRITERPRLVPESDLRSLLARGLETLVDRYGRDSIGAYLEFGVYNGTSLLCMYRELQRLGLDHVRLFGFDSFQGLPPSAAFEDEGRWEPGRCYSPLAFTTAVLDAEGVDWNRVTLVPGWFSDTLNDDTIAVHNITRASVIMIDCDLYSSTREALEFCAPLIGDAALVLFDEFHPRGLRGKNVGERKAFQEFLGARDCFAVEPFGKYAERTETFLLTRTRAEQRPTRGAPHQPIGTSLTGASNRIRHSPSGSRVQTTT